VVPEYRAPSRPGAPPTWKNGTLIIETTRDPRAKLPVGAATKPVQPEDVAGPIIDALLRPKTHVSIPGPMRFVAALASMLGPRGRRWLGRRLSLDRIFLDVDTTARKAYADRARNATGLSEHRD